MESANEPGEKICALCGLDCSKRPRTKDDAGRYYCRECVERAKQGRQQRHQSAAGRAAPPASPRVEALSADTHFDVLAEVVDDLSDAPALEVASVAPPPTSRPLSPTAHLPPSYEDRGFSVKLPEFIKRPWFTFTLPAMILYLLFDHAQGNPNSASTFLVPQLLFSVIVWIIILVEAFRDGIGTGLLTLFLPFYILYYVLSVNESPHIKALFAVSLIAGMAGFLLVPDLGSAAQTLPVSLP